MSAQTQHGEAPLTYWQRYRAARREREAQARREELEALGHQLALDLESQRGGGSGGVAPETLIPDPSPRITSAPPAPPRTEPTPRARPSLADCARESWRAFE